VNDEVDEPQGRESPETLIYHVTGIFFFGAAASVSSVLDRVTGNYRNFILDCAAVPYIDSTAANVIESAVRKARKQNMRFVIAGATPAVRHLLETHHVREPDVRYFDHVADAQAALSASQA
jgi:sulfate permease, SulP family